MRRALLLCSAWVALGAGTASAQTWLEAVFPERSFDFGTVARGSKVRHAFKVVNTTDRELHIADVRTKCGCTDVRVGAHEIPPGTQTVVEATIDTTKFQGYKASGLVLVLDRPSFQEVDLNLTCFIRGDVLLSPGLVDFGTVARRTRPAVTLTLTYAGGQPDWGVTRMQTHSPLLSAKLVELARSPGQVQYQLTATLDPSTPSGFFKDEITLQTNDPSSPTIPVSVAANVQAAVTASPSIMNLGRVRPGQVVKKTVLVRSGQPFRVTKLEATRPELAAADTAPADAPRPMHAVTVTFTAPKEVGPYNTVLEVATDLKDEPPLKLTTFATIVP